jgi:segregation and condensation protein B
MLSDETLKAVIEGILYVAPEPVTLDAIVKSLDGEERERVKAMLQALAEDYERAEHGIQIRQIAGGYKFSTKPEHHEVLRKFVKSLKPPIRLSRQALETLAVIAYRQPVTLPEIDAIRGVDCGGVIHTLLEKKLVVTAGRKNVVGRPILYRTSRDFLVHFGLKDVSELPSLKEFEEMARQALGSELTLMEMGATSELASPTEEQATVEPPPAEAPAGEMPSGEVPADEPCAEAEPESAAETDPEQSSNPDTTGPANEEP